MSYKKQIIQNLITFFVSFFIVSLNDKRKKIVLTMPDSKTAL